MIDLYYAIFICKIQRNRMSVNLDSEWLRIEKYISPYWNSHTQGKSGVKKALQVVKNLFHIVSVKCSRAWHCCFSADKQSITNATAKDLAARAIAVIKLPPSGNTLDIVKNATLQVEEMCRRLKNRGAEPEAQEIEADLAAAREETAPEIERLEHQLIHDICDGKISKEGIDFSVVFNRLNTDPKNENSYSQWLLASCYEYGLGCEADPASAFRWYSAAAESGNPHAMNTLGVCYAEGIGVEKDLNKAIACYLKAEKDLSNDIIATNLAGCYEDIKDYDNALHWFDVAVERGHPEAASAKKTLLKEIKKEASRLRKGKHAEESIKLFTIAATHGDSRSMYWLGTANQLGIGMPKNEAAALKWYTLAAESGHVAAMERLFDSYRRGIGTDKNPDVALKWCRKYLESGGELIDPVYDLHRLEDDLLDSLMTKKSTEKPQCDLSNALKRYMNGGKEKLVSLLAYHRVGLGNEESLAKAVEIFKEGARKGIPDAELALGCLLYEGLGMPKNIQEAYGLFDRILARSDEEQSAAYFYQKIGKTEEAFDIFKHHAEAGYPGAMYNLGKCYETGSGIKEDQQQARMWFKKAIEAGYTREI